MSEIAGLLSKPPMKQSLKDLCTFFLLLLTFRFDLQTILLFLLLPKQSELLFKSQREYLPLHRYECYLKNILRFLNKIHYSNAKCGLYLKIPNRLQISSNFLFSEVCNFLEQENPLGQKLPQSQHSL